MRTAETRLSSAKADATHSSGGRTLWANPASKAAMIFEQTAKITPTMLINSMFLTLTDSAIRSRSAVVTDGIAKLPGVFGVDHEGTIGRVVSS